MLIVTGASGFVGEALIREARSQGLDVAALLRPSSDASRLGLPADRILRAELSDPAGLERALREARRVAAGARPDASTAPACAIVHAAATTSETTPDWELSYGVNVVGTRNLLQACAQVGVRRFVQISSQSAKPSNPSVYGKTKHLADQEVLASSLDSTILKPNVVYGPGDRGIFNKFTTLLRKLPFIPVIGPGKQPLRPVLAADLARATLAAVREPRAVGKTYLIGGGEEIDFNAMATRTLTALGLSKPLVHLPIWLCRILAFFLGLVSRRPPITKDNVQGAKLLEKSSNAEAQADFGYEPLSFGEGLKTCFPERSAPAEEADEKLAREVDAFHAVLFPEDRPPATALVRYISAHRQGAITVSRVESRVLETFLDRRSKLAAAELVWRARDRKNILSRKLHAYLYLMEAEPSHFEYFVNSSPAGWRAWRALAVAGARSAWHRAVGAWALARLGATVDRGV